ncbi:hypothetical protein E2C01_059287 [Portunus trituberculatus]|uniref:Uncharacterized protein n=1 Tax=Portunus trituberculatus TaxID=210409 RepID=A0A5B7H7X2_PORTR|nr:hypothetical protein [Portunus trituberculatus]
MEVRSLMANVFTILTPSVRGHIFTMRFVYH